MTGLLESSGQSAMSSFSSSVQGKFRADLPSPSHSFSRSKSAASASGFLSPPLAAFLQRSIRRSTRSMSESTNSRLMVSISRAGPISPLTCTISPSLKQRTTWMMASTSRIWERNLLPRPSPWEAPFTSPAISTNSMTAGVTLSGEYISHSLSSRGSGTGTMPTFGSMVQKG